MEKKFQEFLDTYNSINAKIPQLFNKLLGTDSLF